MHRHLAALLAPAAKINVGRLSLWVVALLVASATLVLAATAAMPAGYSWRANAISESAAQGLRDAWIARLAFLCFGGAVLLLSLLMRRAWGRVTYWMHLVFALAMLGTAAFSHKPWIAGVPVDEFEDFLHSLTASGMGFAFCIGVTARFLQRNSEERFSRVFDAVAMVVATAMPMLAASKPDAAGLVQRAMFALAYVWYAKEALHLRRSAAGQEAGIRSAARRGG